MSRFPAIQDAPVLGPVQVVPPPGLAAQRGLHLDRTCAPAVTWQLTKRTHEQDHLESECPRFQGNPDCKVRLWVTGVVVGVSAGMA